MGYSKEIVVGQKWQHNLAGIRNCFTRWLNRMNLYLILICASNVWIWGGASVLPFSNDFHILRIHTNK